MLGPWKGMRGVIFEASRIRDTYKVKLTDGSVTGWIQRNDFASSGLDEATCHAHIDDLPALGAAIEALPSEARQVVGAVRERVAQDSLPLLNLLQIDPLEMQSSHLSFQ
eukprot:1884696-Prymnesium_polylepis.1